MIVAWIIGTAGIVLTISASMGPGAGIFVLVAGLLLGWTLISIEERARQKRRADDRRFYRRMSTQNKKSPAQPVKAERGCNIS